VAPANAGGLIGHVLVTAGPDGHPGTRPAAVTGGQVPGGHAYTRTRYQDPAGATLAECWIIHQGRHAWSGGVPNGSYSDPHGPTPAPNSSASSASTPLPARAARRPEVSARVRT
jgi:hypothetical protein